jgi:hypothetical protein
MGIPGRVSGGVVVLEGGASLPEGTPVIVSCSAAIGAEKAAEPRRIQVPLVRTSRSGTVNLTGERAAELLDEEDASPRR